MKKYELTSNFKMFSGKKIFQIRALVDLKNGVKAGELGGWIEKEENLSHNGNAWVSGKAQVYGDAQVSGNAWVYGDAEIYSSSHVLVIGAVGSRNDFTTFYRDKDNEITVKCGCFLGKLDDFLEKVTQKHGNSKYALVYRAAAEVAKLQIDLSGETPEDTTDEA